jgi:hypothetical protein
LNNPILISGGLPAYPRRRRAAPIMRGVAAEVSAQRSGAANGGGGPQGSPTRTCCYNRKRGRGTLNASAFRFTWLDF